MKDASHDDSHLFPRHRQPALRTVAMPADTNAAGHIFGGWIMSQMDVAGAIVANEYAGGCVATVAVTSMEFHKPVYVGDLISCFAKIEQLGNTSITVKVEVFAQRRRKQDEAVHYIKVTEAVIVYVALNGKGVPINVPKREPDFSAYL